MQILERDEFGYTYLGEDHNYYSVIDNSKCNAFSGVYLLTLGPKLPYERCNELLFWVTANYRPVYTGLFFVCSLIKQQHEDPY